MERGTVSANDSPGPPLVGAVLKVGSIVVLVVLLYVVVARSVGTQSTGERLDVGITQAGTNWSVRFSSVPGGRLPSEMFLVLRDSSGAITLPRTPFENLSAADWPRTRAQYEDGNPLVSEVRPGDRLVIDLAAHPSESMIEISDIWSVLLIRKLL